MTCCIVLLEKNIGHNREAVKTSMAYRQFNAPQNTREEKILLNCCWISFQFLLQQIFMGLWVIIFDYFVLLLSVSLAKIRCTAASTGGCMYVKQRQQTQKKEIGNI